MSKINIEEFEEIKNVFLDMDQKKVLKYGNAEWILRGTSKI